MKGYFRTFSLCLGLVCSWPGSALAEEKPDEKVLQMDVKDFFNMYQDVFSAAMKTQKLKDTSSAVYILDQDDIRRSAATTIPDLLRLVPGVQVARIGANSWAVSVRGGSVSDEFASQLLVMIDSVPIVTPLFNGVYWEAYNLPLDSIERIEVVRGPGAAVWGNRAENGVINIITKNASNPTKPTVSLGGGDEHQASIYVKQGAKLGENSGLNLSLKYDRYDDSIESDDTRLNDGGDIVSLTTRADIKVDEKTDLRVMNYSFGRSEGLVEDLPILTDPYVERMTGTKDHYGTVFSTLWSRKFSDESQLTVDWSHFAERQKDFTFDYALYNTDLDVRYRFRPLENHDFVVGGSTRLYFDDFAGTFFVSLEPRKRQLQFFRAFFHDEISLLDKKLIATIGARFEQNSQNGFSPMPTARLLWHATERTSLWGAASYTAGTTSRIYDDVRNRAGAFLEPESGLPAVLQFTGSRSTPSEKLFAYEAGARMEPNDSFYIDVAGFYFSYNDILSTELGEPVLAFDEASQTDFLIAPLIADSRYRAESYGGEVAMTLKASSKLKFVGTYSYYSAFARNNNSTDPLAEIIVENLPANVASLRASYDLTSEIEVDAVFRFVDTLRRVGVDSYGQVDARIGWKVLPNLSLNLIGRNLLEQGHEEFQSLSFPYPRSQVERSVFGQAIMTF